MGAIRHGQDSEAAAGRGSWVASGLRAHGPEKAPLNSGTHPSSKFSSPLFLRAGRDAHVLDHKGASLMYYRELLPYQASEVCGLANLPYSLGREPQAGPEQAGSEEGWA